MAHTALDEDEIQEFQDDADTVRKKVKELADEIRTRRGLIAYTGAGISTSAGVPDFRGPGGVWTLRAKGETPKAPPAGHVVEPTLCHMSLVALVEAGLMDYLISTNCDGLHIKSGIPIDKLIELHGCKNVEACPKCGRAYYRGFNVCPKPPMKTRLTGRNCDDCGARLRYTPVAFGQSLPDTAESLAEARSANAQVCLVMGTSMRVSPACEHPMLGVRNGATMCIVNLQKTPYDDDAKIRIFAKTDDVMKLLMAELGLEIPAYRDLALHENAEFQAAFDGKYAFRTPSEEWFDGPL